MLLWAKNLCRRVIATSAFWFLLNVASMSATVFFTTYVVQERGWAAGDIAILGLPILISAFAVNLLTGTLLDKVGRRVTLTRRDARDLRSWAH